MNFLSQPSHCPLCEAASDTPTGGVCGQCGLPRTDNGALHIEQPGPGLFHYTTGMFLPRIVRSRHIALAGAGVPHGERLAAWFSTEPVWECTVGWPLEVAARAWGAARIRVRPEAAPLRWEDHRRLHPHMAAWLDAVERVSLDQGSDPARWRLAYTRVWSAEWLSIEKWQEGRWTPVWTRGAKN